MPGIILYRKKSAGLISYILVAFEHNGVWQKNKLPVAQIISRM